jgi:hypothetical protein
MIVLSFPALRLDEGVQTVDPRRAEQAELVVVAQLLDAQPAQPGEPSDGQEPLGHVVIVHPPIVGESRRQTTVGGRP